AWIFCGNYQFSHTPVTERKLPIAIKKNNARSDAKKTSQPLILRADSGAQLDTLNIGYTNIGGLFCIFLIAQYENRENATAGSTIYKAKSPHVVTYDPNKFIP